MTETLFEALKLMVVGMAGVFLVLFILYLVSFALLILFPEGKRHG